jgi:LCP family protein required for cell wall assembly
MPDTPSSNDPDGRESSRTSGIADSTQTRSRGRRRLGWRIATLSALSVLVLVGATVAAGFAVVSHLAGKVQRIHVARLAAVAKPAGGPSGQAMNVLITGQDQAPGTEGNPSGLIMILHINADQQAGGAVSIHPLAMVQVPGHGQTELQNALVFGGPSLLVQTVEQLTNVPLDHYARIDLPHVANVVDAVGGVDIPTPGGTVHFDGAGALAWARDPALSEEGRVLRQQSLIRAVMRKLANDHLLTSPVTMFHVLSALTSMLTVDSNFTNSELLSLARELGGLSSSAGTFIIAPFSTVGGQVFLDPVISHQLWAAIRQDSLAAFAQKYPSTVTPEVVP